MNFQGKGKEKEYTGFFPSKIQLLFSHDWLRKELRFRSVDNLST